MAAMAAILDSDKKRFTKLWSTGCLNTSYQVKHNWHFGSREEVQNGFSRWWLSWISSRSDFSNFWCTNHPSTSCQVSSQLAFWHRRFKMLFVFFLFVCFFFFRFSSQTDFSYFDLQVTLILSTKFRDKCLSVQSKKSILDFQDGDRVGHLRFPIGTVLLVFFINKSPQYLLSKFELIGISV